MFRDFVLKNDLGSVECNKSFKELTTIGIGGAIKYLYIPKDIEALRIAYKFINENNLKHFILGCGSNVLASDYYYDGIVILLSKIKGDIEYLESKIRVSAFVSCNRLVFELSKKCLGDLSYLVGIPGLVGGAIYNNCGSFGKTISMNVISVRYIDTYGEIQEIDNKECRFGYRKSIFHYIEGIILDAVICVIECETKDKIKRYMENRSRSQPINFKSMGSVFKNNPLIPAWQVIDALGLRGFQMGDAKISDKHTNFILNIGAAKASDVMNLIELIEARANLELGIKMVPEITII